MKRKIWFALLGASVLTLGASAVQAQLRLRDSARPMLDRSCVRECRSDLTDCLEDAAGELADCAEPCADERAAVRAACADDPTTPACADARAALRTCVGPCLQTYDPAVEECFHAARACVGVCPPDDDAPCLRACIAQRAECFADLRAEVKTCRDRCRAEVAAARRLCADDPTSEECRAATVAARACLAPCGRLLHQGIHECRREARVCYAACDDTEGPVDGSNAAP